MKKEKVVLAASLAHHLSVQKFTKIITHPGGAHKDDFLACAVMLTACVVPISRREPSQEDLDDPATCVIDVGGRYEPSLLNFDHHQFPQDEEPTCALSLVLKNLGLYEDAKVFCEWLETAEWFDCRGPGKTAEWLGVGREVVAKLNSPIDITALRHFSQGKEHQPGELVYEFMLAVGRDLVGYLRGVRENLSIVKKHVQRWEIEYANSKIIALFLPRHEETLKDASGSLAKYIIYHQLENEVAGLVYPDSRGVGYGIARFNDHPNLDFNRVHGDDDVHFAHASGFLCKTSATEEDRLRSILLEAWTR